MVIYYRIELLFPISPVYLKNNLVDEKLFYR